ncbi:MAG: hypothetical protein IJD01_08885 [Clostridia bacterium]|nr:hypothetical protein [Clostridia bacterium]
MNEQALRLLTLLGETEEPYDFAEQKPRMRWLKIVLSAAACAAVLAVGVFVGLGRGKADAPSAVPDTGVTLPSSLREQGTSCSKITYVSPMGCYAEGPSIGEAFVEYPLEHLKQRIAEKGRVLLKISLEDENGPVLHSEAVYEELDRLKALGYELYIYEEDGVDYWGAPRPVTHICTYVTTAQQIERFPVGDRFAYWISPYYFSVPIEEYTRY